MAPFLQLLVEVIEENVAQERGQRAALWSSLDDWLDQTIFENASFQELSDQLQSTLILDFAGHPRHKDVVVHSVKEAFQVDIDNPSEPLGNKLSRLQHRILRAPTRTESKAPFREPWLENRSQDLHQRLLHETVEYRGYSQLPESATWLWDFSP